MGIPTLDSIPSNHWIYLLVKTRLPEGDIKSLTENEILGKWKYRIEKNKFIGKYTKLFETVSLNPIILNAKFKTSSSDSDYIKLNVYCLAQDKKVLELIKKETGFVPYRWKTDKETMHETFHKAFDAFSTDLAHSMKELWDFDENTKDGLIEDSIRDFMQTYNDMVKSQGFYAYIVSTGADFVQELKDKVKGKIKNHKEK